MNSFDSVPRGSLVLLTPPVILYSMFAQKGRTAFPLSSDCQAILERCYRGEYQGLVTTGIVARCWKVLHSISPRVDGMEEDAFGTEAFQRPNLYPFLSKRIQSLLRSELDLIQIKPEDFGPASQLVNSLQIPTTLALDMAATFREQYMPERDGSSVSPVLSDTKVYVALASPKQWNHSVFLPCWARDIPAS